MSGVAKAVPQILKVARSVGRISRAMQKEIVKNLPPLGEHPTPQLVYNRSYRPHQIVTQTRWARSSLN